MTIFLILVLVGLLFAVVFSLARGVFAFLQSTRDSLENGDDEGATELQLKQNRMMFARVKYQALAILVVALLLAFAR